MERPKLRVSLNHLRGWNEQIEATGKGNLVKVSQEPVLKPIRSVSDKVFEVWRSPASHLIRGDSQMFAITWRCSNLSGGNRDFLTGERYSRFLLDVEEATLPFLRTKRVLVPGTTSEECGKQCSPTSSAVFCI